MAMTMPGAHAVGAWTGMAGRLTHDDGFDPNSRIGDLHLKSQTLSAGGERGNPLLSGWLSLSLYCALCTLDEIARDLIYSYVYRYTEYRNGNN